MTKNEILNRANEYLAQETDEHFKAEVRALIEKKDFAELEDRFYQSLAFGTGGLRGVIAGGTNRMNPLVIKKATQGLANYIVKTNPQKAKRGELKAVVAFDSRHFSDVFAEATALIFAANGFTAYLFSSMRPTPELSFAIRELGCDTGVVVTASHNPPQYNGYKAYWSNGAQVIPPHDAGIIDEVNAVRDIKMISRDEAIKSGRLKVIDKEIDEKFQSMVKSQLFRPALIKEKAGDVKVVYTPLHGTGAMHVEKVLGDLGLHVITVPEQREGNGDFPTVAFPNPEVPEALEMAVNLAKKEKADVVMATDPDADRFGSAVPDGKGGYVLISGNQMGVLLADYITLSRAEFGKMPKNPAIIRSIVTSAMVDRICAKRGIFVAECLTGFKWIAAVTEDFLRTGEHSYIFGFEESYGYTVEDAIRDKSGVSAAAMCAEMTLYWRSKGKSLLDRLNELFCEFGFFENRTVSKGFPGSSGMETMSRIMAALRQNPPKTLAGIAVEKIRDVQESTLLDAASGKKTKIDLPKSNVLQFFLKNGAIFSVRPSGTEPKIKFYIDCPTKIESGLDEAKAKSDEFCAALETEIDFILENLA